VGKADIHIHSAVGDGMAGLQEILDYVEAATDLSVIAITDHDDAAGGLAARDLWARGRYRFDVIAGIELTTLEGHLVALFIEEPVAPLRPLVETLEAVHRQGGLCVIPHPMNWLTRSIGERTIDRIMLKRGTGVYFDAIQIANSGPGAQIAAGKSLRLNRERYHLPEVGGSDAHFLPVIGAAHTVFSGETAADLRKTILEGTTSGVNGRYPSLSEIGYRQFLAQQWRGFSVTPRKTGWLPTIASFVKRWRPR
jgi:predicted metal-dependent phosphoesterase TrpH